MGAMEASLSCLQKVDGPKIHKQEHQIRRGSQKIRTKMLEWTTIKIMI